MNIRKILREGLAFKGMINEIDWEDTFSDVRPTCTDAKKIVDYLNRVRANATVDYGEREKFDAGMPFVHGKSSFFKKDEGLDIDYFIQQMTQKPNNIINTNEKILKSGGQHEFVYKTGIPAFRGIAYDIDKSQFLFINTCPGAGSCQAICYALKGRFIQYPAAYDSMTRRLNYLLNYPDEYEAQLYEELKGKCKEHSALKGYKGKVILRWNDSGDFFTKKYTQIAENVMKQLQTEGYNIESYAYTKMADVAKDSEFGQTTFSAGSNKKQGGMVDKDTQKMSEVIPKELFKGLNLMKIEDEKKLKINVSNYFKLDPNNILTYDELMSTPKSDVPRWNVIVTPNDGDDAAFRPDVKNVLLTQH
mgnify:FL=1|tara:strand:- start:8132 stop:9214 length:1083 start_codon:yes stop_codon:yes gene_type:complete